MKQSEQSKSWWQPASKESIQKLKQKFEEYNNRESIELDHDLSKEEVIEKLNQIKKYLVEKSTTDVV